MSASGNEKIAKEIVLKRPCIDDMDPSMHSTQCNCDELEAEIKQALDAKDAELAALRAEVERLRKEKEPTIDGVRWFDFLNKVQKENAALRAEVKHLKTELICVFPVSKFEEMERERQRQLGVISALETQLRQMREALELVLKRGHFVQNSDQYMREVLEAAKKALGQGQHGQ